MGGLVRHAAKHEPLHITHAAFPHDHQDGTDLRCDIEGCHRQGRWHLGCEPVSHTALPAEAPTLRLTSVTVRGTCSVRRHSVTADG